MRNIYAGRYKRYMLVPAVLLLVFASFLLFFGITPGIDISGGTLLIIDTPGRVDSQGAVGFLESRFDLVDLKASSTSSPLGNKLRVEFIESRPLAETRELLESAKDSLESNPSESKEFSMVVLEKNSAFVGEDYSESDTAERLYELARDSFLKEKESFNQEILGALSERFNLPEDAGIQSEEVNPVLGQAFWEGAVWIGVMGMVLIIIVIFGFFRVFLPSVAIVFAALFDALAALSAMALFGIPLGLATIPTILLLFGYSIDTDILLTTRVLHRRDSTPRERAHDSMITGMTMTATAISAVLVMLVFSYFLQIDIMFTIAFILFFGLLADIVATWLMNAPMLLWYAEKKQGVGE